MHIAVLKERRPGETRVSASPDTVKKSLGLGCKVTVERGAGNAASISDADYTAVGATVVMDAATACANADMVFKVMRPMTAAEGGFDEVAILRPGSILVAH